MIEIFEKELLSWLLMGVDILGVSQCSKNHVSQIFLGGFSKAKAFFYFQMDGKYGV